MRTAALTLILAGSTLAYAGQAPTEQQLASAKKDGSVPTTFVTKAAVGGLTEVEAAKLALAQSQSAGVRRFAERMIQDHGKANTELATIAKGKNLSVPMSPDAEHQAALKSLGSKKGTDFDAAYHQQMVADHAETIALFEGAAASSDAQLSAFAKKTLPTLREHAEMAQQLH